MSGGPPRNCRGGWYSRPSIGRWRWMCVLAAPAPWTPGAYRMDMDMDMDPNSQIQKVNVRSVRSSSSSSSSASSSVRFCTPGASSCGATPGSAASRVSSVGGSRTTVRASSSSGKTSSSNRMTGSSYVRLDVRKASSLKANPSPWFAYSTSSFPFCKLGAMPSSSAFAQRASCPAPCRDSYHPKNNLAIRVKMAHAVKATTRSAIERSKRSGRIMVGISSGSCAAGLEEAAEGGGRCRGRDSRTAG